MSRWGSSKKKINYFREMLLHKYNINSGLAAVAAGTILSIPFGFGVGLIPVVLYGAGVSVASLFVPGSSRFRESVDKRRTQKQREAARTHLLAEIRKRVGVDHSYWGIYERLISRRNSLRKIAKQADTALSQEDVDRLDDSTVDFLGLWLARIVVHDRAQAVQPHKLKARIGDIESKLEAVESDADRRRLIKAKGELESLIKRHQEMMTRETAMEASMLSMADTFDELYQRVMADPTSREQVAVQVRVAVDRMDAEEELDYMLDEDVEALLRM